jgi:hypothetical protein
MFYVLREEWLLKEAKQYSIQRLASNKADGSSPVRLLGFASLRLPRRLAARAGLSR